MFIQQFLSKMIIFLILFSSPLLAHDFWLEPSTYRFTPNTPIQFRIHIGHLHDSISYPRNPFHIKKFSLENSKLKRNILGIDGLEPAGVATLKEKGTFIVGYLSQGSQSTMEKEEFRKYLKEEGLLHIPKESFWKEVSQEIKEKYYRCAKIIISEKTSISEDHKHCLNFPLEFVPLENPYSPEKQEKLSFQILFQGKPLVHALVSAQVKENTKWKEQVRSNQEGLITVPKRKGTWLLSAVHLEKSMAEEEDGADWESYWASLVFKIEY